MTYGIGGQLTIHKVNSQLNANYGETRSLYHRDAKAQNETEVFMESREAGVQSDELGA